VTIRALSQRAVDGPPTPLETEVTRWRPENEQVVDVTIVYGILPETSEIHPSNSIRTFRLLHECEVIGITVCKAVNTPAVIVPPPGRRTEMDFRMESTPCAHPGTIRSVAAESGEDKFEPLLTADEAAKHLRVHVKTIQRLARERSVPCVRMGKYWRFRLSALDAWVAAQQNQVSQPFCV
jgi:excisionase family DNA binding protein